VDQRAQPDGGHVRFPETLHKNLGAAALYEHAIRAGEGELAATGPFVARTGQHTGRSPRDKYVVRDETTRDAVWWDGNQPLEPEAFAQLMADISAHMAGKTLYAQDLFGGADPAYRLRVRVVTEFAWHSLFIRNLLIRPQLQELAGFAPDLTIVDLPSLKVDPGRYGVRSETLIACDFTRRLILICGSAYAGEMKKSVFTYLNFILPEMGVMPMHCSANMGEKGDVALFFGLSGTGKTTLSADPARTLIGDDEHGWGENGVFNFEGGCYAKTIRLSAAAEPQIHAAANRFGTVLENVVLEPESRAPDFDDGSLTENTRAAYPLDMIANASESGRAGHPKTIVMLTCDAFGVMPPVARLSGPQAVAHFLTGYTAKVAGTERGVSEPEATFSTCFGAPFMPRPPALYGRLLAERVARHGAACYLVNTGWTGGGYGAGERMPLNATRAVLAAALSGALDRAPAYTDPYFGFEVPLAVPGVDGALLRPRETWADPAAYDARAAQLVARFGQAFARFADAVDGEVRDAAPRLPAAAE